VWMLFGLGLGLVVAVSVYMSGPRDAGPPATQPAVGRPDPGPAGAPTATRQTPPSPAPASTAAATAAAGEESAPAERRFEFYDLLPQYEVVIPEVEGTVRAPRAEQAIEQPGVYVLQVGSFRALADADRRQAQIALLGIESRIQRVTIDDSVYHRVRIGPLTEVGEVNRIRARLRDERIDSLVIKLPN